MSYLFTPTGIVVTSDQAGNKKTSSNELPVGDYLSRYASQQYFLERSKAGDTVVEYSTIKPEMGPQVIHTKYIDTHDCYAAFKTLPAPRW